MEWPQKIIRIWKLIISPIFPKCKHCLSLMHLPIRNWTVSNPNYCRDLSVIHASVQLQLSHFNSNRWWLQRGSVQTQVKHSEADGGLRGVVGGGAEHIYIYPIMFPLYTNRIPIILPLHSNNISITVYSNCTLIFWSKPPFCYHVKYMLIHTHTHTYIYMYIYTFPITFPWYFHRSPMIFPLISPWRATNKLGYIPTTIKN